VTPEREARRAKALTLTFDVMAAWVAMAIGIAAPFWLAGYEWSLSTLRLITMPALLFATSAGVAFYTLGVHRQVWRHSGWPDAMRIIQAVVLSALIFLPLAAPISNYPAVAVSPQHICHRARPMGFDSFQWTHDCSVAINAAPPPDILKCSKRCARRFNRRRF